MAYITKTAIEVINFVKSKGQYTVSASCIVDVVLTVR